MQSYKSNAFFYAAIVTIGGLVFGLDIGEIAPANMRGKLVSMNQINIVVGVTAAYFINYLIQQVEAIWTKRGDQ